MTRPVVIVGGGPSLRGFDWRRLEGRQVIAINRAYEALPGAQVLWFSDHRFYREHHAGLQAHGAGLKASLRLDRERYQFDAWVTLYRATGLKGFDPDPECLRHGNNGAYAAIHLAVHLGFDRIVLLGCDMAYGSDGASHWHDGHGLGHRERTLTDKMLPWFDTLAEPLAERGIAVINGSSASRLATWPRMTIDEALAW